jgi:hypothetical protein
MAEQATGQLAILVERKHCCLAQLRDLGLQQRRLIEEGDMAPLLRLLASKQHVIETLQSVEHDLGPFRNDDPEARVWDSPQDRARCAAQAAECRDLLEEVVRLERANESLMTHRRAAVADRLQQVHAAARASSAYRVHSRGSAGMPSDLKASAAPFPGPNYSAQGAAPARSNLDISSEIR